MGKLYVLMGKSSTGKDAIYRHIRGKDPADLKPGMKWPELLPVTPYTTRPMRDREQEGVQYFFRSSAEFEAMKKEGRIIEYRTYPSVIGPWHYFTADDGQIDLERGSFIMIGTVDSFVSLKKHFGEDRVCPLYVDTCDRIRLERAMKRENRQEHPRYDEMCRRYLADEEDFSDERLENAGITEKFDNNGELTDCLAGIVQYIDSMERD